MLAGAQVVSFVSTTSPDAARSFYCDALGFKLLRQEPQALVFRKGERFLRMNVVETLPAAIGTVLGWNVPDIDAAVRELNGKGVKFEKYAGMPQDEFGVAMFENGDKVAWFTDPDGNVLSISQLADVGLESESRLAPASRAAGLAPAKPRGEAGHPVVHFEIGCPDRDVSRRFFEEVFGWTASEYGPLAHRFDTRSSRGIQGFTTALGHEPHNYVNLYIETADIGAAVEKIEAHGGSVVIPEMPAPGGRFCWFKDPSGNTLALWSPSDQ